MTNADSSLSGTWRDALCVSIHDVAPETWDECAQLAQAVRAVADIPLTWLVVPRFHGNSARSPVLEAALDTMLSRGDELVLHGFTHLDEGPRHGTAAEWMLRRVYTEREGEFAGIDEIEALNKIEQGLAWFHDRGWPVEGFVAPAWLLGPGAWQAVRKSPFLYTSTFSHFHLLQQQRKVFAPSLVYTARNLWGRAVSPLAVDIMSRLQGDAVSRLQSETPGGVRPQMLARFALHPRDVRYPRLVRHMQGVIARLLETHDPMTKAGFARNTCYQPHAPPKRQCERPTPA
ncbi:MAG: DUF2334 domain-containing protein [Telluria sp.]